ncbi:MAG: ABC transporter ATP-binding protein [Pseudomonadota bacterium]
MSRTAQPLPTALPAFLWHFIRRQPISFALFFLAPVALVLEANVVPYALKLVIDGIAGHTGDRATILERIAPALWLGGLAACGLCIICRLHNWWQGRFIPRFEAGVRMEVLAHVLNQSHAWFADQPAGKIANRIADLPRALERIVMILAWPGVSTLAVFTTSLVLLAQVNARFAWVLAAWIAAHLVVTSLLCVRVQRKAWENADDKSTLGGGIVDSISNITSVRLFSRRDHELAWVGRQQAAEALSNRRLIFATNALRLFMDAAFLTMFGAMAWLLIDAWQRHAIGTGDVVYVFNMTWAVVVQMWFAGQSLTELLREVGVARQALELVCAAPRVVDLPEATQLHVSAGRIVFEDVSFHYRHGQNIFANKSLAIEPGQKVGLVGFSGSGKTTFAHLILRFHDVEKGRILIDGQDIAQVTQESLRECIAMIPQDTALFHRTLMENIGYGRLGATDAEVLEASKHAHCHEFVSGLPDGYRSLVGERGTKLSGGQRQRIAIARAFLKDAPILILDEATSALDSVTERHIQQGLRELMQNRTTIVIAHRLSTLARMDRILVFDKGHVAEDGTHRELLDRDGLYARMWRMQAGGFLPEQVEREGAEALSEQDFHCK